MDDSIRYYLFDAMSEDLMNDDEMYDEPDLEDEEDTYNIA